jgi:hypothetical protein
MKVINETTGLLEDRDNLIRAAVAYNDGILEIGWCSPEDPLLAKFYSPGEYKGCDFIRKSKELEEHIIYSNRMGCYIIKDNLSQREILEESLILGRNGFPYSFNREYEAVHCFDKFKNKQQILSKVNYPLANYLKYSFGVEFETYSGYVPEEICYRDGLIPLRDGSLDGGIEYSTVVLNGNDGLNLLKQQIDTLKKYTAFNKECSLHFHFGDYPVTERHAWSLYLVWKLIENEIEKFIPAYSFKTARYKKSGKDYCKPLPSYNTFSGLYTYLASQKFFGSLTQVHPADPDKRSKWNIHSRYHNVNLVNFVCYTGPKTIEFRFLRPTFNYHKITLWLYIFNAILMYAENLANTSNTLSDITKKVRNREITLSKIIYTMYPDEVSDIIFADLQLLNLVIINQSGLEDYIGLRTDIEDSIIDPEKII